MLSWIFLRLNLNSDSQRDFRRRSQVTGPANGVLTVEFTPLATLPGSQPEERLQVALTRGRDGRVVIDLREQHHADGLGWFDQRRLSLDPRQFRQLQALLGLKDLALDEESPLAEAPRTIPFPGPAEVSPRRAVVEG